MEVKSIDKYWRGEVWKRAVTRLFVLWRTKYSLQIRFLPATHSEMLGALTVAFLGHFMSLFLNCSDEKHASLRYSDSKMQLYVLVITEC